jgi:hypothetical protein
MRISCGIVVAAVLFGCARSAHSADFFWNDDKGIHRNQNADPVDPKLLFETFDTRGIAIDAVKDRLVWSDVLPIAGTGPGGVIRGGGMQGGDIESIVSRLPSPAGVAIDAARRRVYWTDLGDANNPSAVYSANLDGSDARQIVRAASLSEIAGIAIDSDRDQIYFSFINPLLDSLYTGGIARADLDGSNWKPVVAALGRPLGLAIDSAGGELYWADAGLSEGQGAIQAGDLDGQHRRTILGGLGLPYGVALDLAEQNVYWTDQLAGKIQRTAMPGILPFFQDVVTGLPKPGAIAIRNDPPAGSAWNVDANGDWSTTSNWNPSVPYSAGDRAIFGSIITAPRTVSVDSPIVVGRIEFDSVHGYTIAGDRGITLDVKRGDAFIQVTEGSHVVSAPLTLADNAVVTVFGADSNLAITQPLAGGSVTLTKAGAGTLAVKSIRAATLAVNGGAVVLRGSPGSADSPTSVLRELKIAGSPSSPIATLDVAGAAAVVDYSPAGQNPTAEIRQQILAGRGGPGLGRAWSGTGITSSQVQADVAANPEFTSIAYADNATLPLESYDTFRGEPVDKTAVLIAYTRTGDANLDGVVDDDDVTIVGANYAPGVVKAAWAFGDFDYNGFVDDDDVTLLGAFYDPQAAPVSATAASAVVAVPEPATVVMLAAGCIAILMVVAARHLDLYARMSTTLVRVPKKTARARRAVCIGS